MTSYCIGENLQSSACSQFCKANPGKCDQALLSYCSIPSNYTLPVCGCALPQSQYAILKALTPEGLAVPITCDQRCGSTDTAIQLQGQQPCDIGTICVTNLNDVNVISQEVQSGITINQNCGSGPPSGPQSGPPTGPPSTNNFTQKIKIFIGTSVGKISLIVGIILLILIVGVIIWAVIK
jgi:hypothetical protein